MSTEIVQKELIPPERKILEYLEAIAKIRECRERGLKVILAQGAFDIVHIGHLDYLRSAKKHGDVLFVGVENDENIRSNKGEKRPANSLQERLDFLSEFQCVDFVFGFQDTPKYGEESFNTYVKRFSQLNPGSIAVSGWDPNLETKKLQVESAGVNLTIVNFNIRDSSTRLLNMIGYE